MESAKKLPRPLTLDLQGVNLSHESHRTPRSALSPRSSLRLRSSRLPVLRSSLGSYESFETSNTNLVDDEESDVSEFIGLSDDEGNPDIEDEEYAELRKELIQLREEKKKLREERKKLKAEKNQLQEIKETTTEKTEKSEKPSDKLKTKEKKPRSRSQVISKDASITSSFDKMLNPEKSPPKPQIPVQLSSSASKSTPHAHLSRSTSSMKEAEKPSSGIPQSPLVSVLKPKKKPSTRSLTLNRSDIKKIRNEDAKRKDPFDIADSSKTGFAEDDKGGPPLAPRKTGPQASDLTIAYESQAQKQRLLHNVREELINTEREYIGHLDLIAELVMKPLSVKKNFLTDELLLTPKQLSSIFSNLNSLIPVNKEFLRSLVNEMKGECLLGKAFIEISDYLKTYIPYCVNQTNSTKLLNELCENDLQVRSFISALPDIIPEFQNLGVSSFLIKPLQRICKYPLFIRELLKYTPMSHPDYQNLLIAYERIDDVIKEINEKTHNLELQNQMIEIKSMITFPEKLDFVLITPTRSLVKSAEFKMIYKKQTFKGILHFFSDLLLFSKKHIFDDKLTYKAHFPLTRCMVNDLSSKADKKEFWFSIVNRELSQFPFELSASSAAEKAEWLQILRQHSLALLKTPSTSVKMKRYQSGTVNLKTLYS